MTNPFKYIPNARSVYITLMPIFYEVETEYPEIPCYSSVDHDNEVLAGRHGLIVQNKGVHLTFKGLWFMRIIRENIRLEAKHCLTEKWSP